MTIEKQIAQFQSEIESLEAEAKNASKLDLLVSEFREDLTPFFEEQVRGVFSDNPKYWEKKKRLGNRVAFDDPIYISELKAIRLRQKEREETFEKRVDYNQQNYFSKADRAVDWIRNGVSFANKGKLVDAIATFKKANKEVFIIKPPALISLICFNLGKAYFENGNVELGVYYLSKYCGMQNEGDHYKLVLEEILNLEYKYISGNQILKGGKLFGRKFKYTPSKVIFNQTFNVEKHTINLAYKIPYNLEIEYKDNEEITMLDYHYLVQIDNLSVKSVFFELILPLYKFPIYMKEFHGKLIEAELEITELTDSSALYTEIFVIEKLLNSYKHYKENQEVRKLDVMKSVALIEVPLSKVDRIINAYKKFLSVSVVNQKSNEVIDQIAIAEVKKMYDEENRIGHMHNDGILYSEYEYYSKVAEDYGRYRVIVKNLKSGISNPLKAENKKEYEEAKNYYRSLLNDTFSLFEQKVETKEIQHGIFNLDFQDNHLEKLITIQWEKINEILQIDSLSAILRIRIIIEGLIAAVFQKVQLSHQDKDGKALNLKKKCEKINYALESNIERKLHILRTAGNSSNHYVDNTEWDFNKVEITSIEHAEQYIKYLEEVIIYLVKKFRL